MIVGVAMIFTATLKAYNEDDFETWKEKYEKECRRRTGKEDEDVNK